MEKTVRAYAKLNLSLDVVSKMENGYHAMRMVMQSAALYDEIFIALERGGKIRIKTNLRYVPGDERNIAARAAKLFFERAGMPEQGVYISINKNIPVCAGLGGGSADAAAVLRALNNMLGTGFTRKELEEMSLVLGADVPYCIAGGTALAEGIGEILTDLPPLPKCGIVVCKPDFPISTPTLFSKIDCNKIQIRPDTDGITQALAEGSLKEVACRMYNVFETVLPKGAGAIPEIKARLLDFKALGAVMSGTGSAVFGIFDDYGAAAAADEDLKKEYRECFLTEPVERFEI